MTKLERVKSLAPGTRLIVESNTANPKTIGNMRTVVAMRTTLMEYLADEAPGKPQQVRWGGSRWVDFDGERLTVIAPWQGHGSKTIVYRIAA